MIMSLQSSLGVQFGEDYLFLIYLKKFLKEVALDCQEMIPFPPNATGEEFENFCSREISRFIKNNTIGKENIWVSLPRNEFLLRFIILPSSAEENLREVIRYELGKYVPFPGEDVHFDFVTLEKDEGAKTLRLLLLVIKQDVLGRYLSSLQKAGITPLGIEISSSSLLNLFLLGKNEGEAKTPIALVHVGEGSFELNWINRGMLRYSRAVYLDSEDYTKQAQQIHQELRNSFRGAFSLSAWKGEKKANPPVVFLTGGGVSGDLIDSLGKTQDVDFQMFPTESIASRLNLSNPLSQRITSGIGLALRGMKRVPYDINLLPHPLRKKTSKVGLYFCLLLFCAVLIFSAAWGVSTIVKDRLELHNIETEIATLKNEVIAIQAIQQEAQNIIEEIEGLERIQKSESSKLEVLKELSNILPASVWLTNFRYYKKELHLSGYAASASDLIAILDGSLLFTASEFTAPITRDREGNESFKIKTAIEGR